MKKARLDLLEEMPEIEIARPAVGEAASEEQAVEASVETGKKWAWNKMLMIAAPVLLAVIIVVGVLAYYLSSSKAPVPSRTTVAEKPKPVTVEPVAKPDVPVGPAPVDASGPTRTIYVKDFMIDLKDNAGNTRILLCDVAFDIAVDGEGQAWETRPDVRNMIYSAAKSRGAVALKSIEERKKLKKDLASQLDRMAGKSIVKNVHFTRYFIL